MAVFARLLTCFGVTMLFCSAALAESYPKSMRCVFGPQSHGIGDPTAYYSDVIVVNSEDEQSQLQAAWRERMTTLPAQSYRETIANISVLIRYAGECDDIRYLNDNKISAESAQGVSYTKISFQFHPRSAGPKIPGFHAFCRVIKGMDANQTAYYSRVYSSPPWTIKNHLRNDDMSDFDEFISRAYDDRPAGSGDFFCDSGTSEEAADAAMQRDKKRVLSPGTYEPRIVDTKFAPHSPYSIRK